MTKKAKDQPYILLGKELLNIRLSVRETIAEVSGAVEIDVKSLERMEHGEELPSEDVLMLLISHFNLKEDYADKLWELAGYGTDDPLTDAVTLEVDKAEHHSLVIMMPIDSRVLYSNNAIISADNNGIILNFLQSIVSVDGKTQQIPVTRVGMSHNQARDLLRTLARALNRNDTSQQPKRLTAPKDKKTDNN